jgi:hypothetical protein
MHQVATLRALQVDSIKHTTILQDEDVGKKFPAKKNEKECDATNKGSLHFRYFM